MRVIHSIWSLCWVLWAFSAQAHTFKFEKITVEVGLSENTVSSIVQDATGFMWFATQNGLNKYDGYDFSIYREKGQDTLSIHSDNVELVFVDSRKRMWVAASGLHLFDYKQEKFYYYPHNPLVVTTVASNKINCMLEDHNGTIWIGTNSGLSRMVDFNGKGRPFFKNMQKNPNDSLGLAHNNILSLFEDSEGILWVGTEGGLHRLNPDKRTFTRFVHDAKKPTSLIHNAVRSITEDTRGNLWIATPEGISCLTVGNRSRGNFVHYTTKNTPNLPSNTIRVLYKDQDGWLWAGTTDGLCRILTDNPEKPIFITYKNNPLNPHSLSDNNIKCITEDRDGILWFGTFMGGVNKLDKQKEKFQTIRREPHQENTLSNSFITSFYEQGNVLWVGTYFGGLNKISYLGTEVHYRDFQVDNSGITNNTVKALYADNDGFIWLATDGGGLNKFEPMSEKFTVYDATQIGSNDVYSVIEDAERNIWVSTAAGLYRKPPTLNSFIKIDLKELQNIKISQICESKSGLIWLATDNGVFVYNKITTQVQPFKVEYSQHNGLSNEHITCLYEDGKGVMWIGTHGGVFKYENQKFIAFTTKDGLSDNLVHAIVGDQQNTIWISTNKGLSRLYVETENFRNYDVSDGLQSNEFNTNAVHKGKSGKIYLGGINGFNAFFSEWITDNPALPTMVITEFSIFNQLISHTKNSILSQHISYTPQIELSPEQTSFSMAFAALQYSTPNKNLYAYRLEGFDKDWIYTSAERRFVSYTNLPAGEYTFQLIGANADGIWNEKPILFKISIQPHVWERAWFRLLLFGTVVFLLFLSQRKNAVRMKREAIETLKSSLEKAFLYRIRSKTHYDTQDLDTSNPDLPFVTRFYYALMKDREQEIKELLQDGFLIHKSLRKGGGDFLWINNKSGLITVALMDCTGHEEKGAFIAITVEHYLNYIVNNQEIQEPHEILHHLNRLFMEAMEKNIIPSQAWVKIGICIVDPTNHVVLFAGAGMNLVFVQENNVQTFKGNRISIGRKIKKEVSETEFDDYAVATELGVEFYMYTDGFSSQFGASNNAKFKTKRIKQLIADNHHNSMYAQKNIYITAIREWIKNAEQIDDMMMIGFRLK